MSWSVAAIGKATAVAAAIEDQFTRAGACMEPEETIRQAARTAIAVALAGETATGAVVKVTAAGSQSQTYDNNGKPSGLFTNGLSLSIEPQYGFVE